jgi:hypothetical protein
MGETAQVFPKPGRRNSAGVSPRSSRYFPLPEEGTVARQEVRETEPEPTLRHLIEWSVCLGVTRNLNVTWADSADLSVRLGSGLPREPPLARLPKIPCRAAEKALANSLTSCGPYLPLVIRAGLGIR